MKNRKVLAALAALILLVTVAAISRGGESKTAETAASADDLFATAEIRDLNVQAEAPGQVEPIRVVEVKSKASGEVLGLHAETGDLVERGALLAEVDPRDVRNSLLQAQADVEVARVRARTAEAQRKRVQELLEAQVATEQEYEAAALEAANAQATLVRAETNLELAQDRMGDVTIRAPISGTVIERSVEVGQIIASAMSNVSGGTTLLRMADLSEVQVRTLVDETDIGRIAPGQRAQVEVEAYPNRTFVGEVLKIEPQAVVEQNVTMFPVLIRLDNPEGLLKPGMNAEVQVQIARRPQAVTIPNAAVASVQDAASVGQALGLSEDAVTAALQKASGGTGAAEDPMAECRGLREKIQRAGGPGGLGEEDRALARECRERFMQARSGGGQQDGGPRPGVVFVDTGTGLEARRVMLGVSDWENTEVVEGLEAGDKVVLVSVARIQQQQEELLGRIRERAGGPLRGN